MITTTQKSWKVIVVVDLWRFRDIAQEITKLVGSEGVTILKRQIHQMIESALARSGAKLSDLATIGTGDGKILAFETADAACRFAEMLHHVAEDGNRDKDSTLQRRHFRIGIVTGEINYSVTRSGDTVIGHELDGLAVADASRLEGACKTGEILICPETYVRLTDELKKPFGREEEVEVKHETMRAHRWQVVQPAPGVGSAKPDIPHAKGEINAAIQNGLSAVDEALLKLVPAGKSPSLVQIGAIIATAICHGAGIYNDGSHYGCALIYLHTAQGIVARSPSPVGPSPGGVATGGPLAVAWLANIAVANPEVEEWTADALAWELRFAFDAIRQIPLLENIAAAITGARLHRDKTEKILGDVVALSRELLRTEPPFCAYLLRHTASAMLAQIDASKLASSPAQDAILRWEKKLRDVVVANPRIDRENAMQLADEIATLFQDF